MTARRPSARVRALYDARDVLGPVLAHLEAAGDQAALYLGLSLRADIESTIGAEHLPREKAAGDGGAIDHLSIALDYSTDVRWFVRQAGDDRLLARTTHLHEQVRHALGQALEMGRGGEARA